jgi:hypothetical protein
MKELRPWAPPKPGRLLAKTLGLQPKPAFFFKKRSKKQH